MAGRVQHTSIEFATLLKNPHAVVCVGCGVHLAFCENDCVSEDDVKAMEGVHTCFYANDFEGLFNRLHSRNLIWIDPRFTRLDSCDTWEEAFACRKNVSDLLTEKKILERRGLSVTDNT